jgi:hypothetical protein
VWSRSSDLSQRSSRQFARALAGLPFADRDETVLKCMERAENIQFRWENAITSLNSGSSASAKPGSKPAGLLESKGDSKQQLQAGGAPAAARPPSFKGFRVGGIHVQVSDGCVLCSSRPRLTVVLLSAFRAGSTRRLMLPCSRKALRAPTANSRKGSSRHRR